jgi:hypothetical protein
MIVTFGESYSLAEFCVEPNVPVPEARRLVSQLAQLGKSADEPARYQVVPRELGDELPPMMFLASLVESARVRNKAIVAVMLA